MRPALLLGLLLILLLGPASLAQDADAPAGDEADAAGAAGTEAPTDPSGATPSPPPVPAQPTLPPFELRVGGEDGTGLGPAVRIVLILTVLTLAPALIITLTSFTRIIIVLSFIRRALALQTLPPNQVLVGLSIFLTIAVMYPVFTDIKTEAYDPFQEEKIEAGEAADKAATRLSKFLVRQTREEDVALFLEVAHEEPPASAAEVPFHVLVPAFIISELRTAFQMGFLIFLPFLIIDLVISGILLSMGMFMLPPTIISTPFKIILFVLVDGWNLVVRSLFMSFGGV